MKCFSFSLSLFFFLSETLKCVDFVVKIKLLTLGFVNAVGVDVIRRSGGLFLGWTDEFEVQLLACSKNWIHAKCIDNLL